MCPCTALAGQGLHYIYIVLTDGRGAPTRTTESHAYIRQENVQCAKITVELHRFLHQGHVQRVGQ